MAIARQFSIACENRPGSLARLCSTLARARKALAAAGYPVSETRVILQRLPNRPGALAAARAGVPGPVAGGAVSTPLGGGAIRGMWR